MYWPLQDSRARWSLLATRLLTAIYPLRMLTAVILMWLRADWQLDREKLCCFQRSNHRKRVVDECPIFPQFGVAISGRLGRDVLLQPDAKAVILLAGINDIGDVSTTADVLIAVDQQIILACHQAGLKIYGGTLTPFGGSNAIYGGNYGTPFGNSNGRN